MQNKVQRHLSIDVLKMILAVSVVFLHTHLFKDVSVLLSHSLVQGVFRLAVPIFLVVTGYYFFSVNHFEKYQKWLKRIAGLYLLWTLLYLPIWWSKIAFYNWFSVLYGYYVLWYLMGVLLGGSLLYALRNCRASLLFGLSLLLFLTGFMIQELGNLHLFSGAVDRSLNLGWLHRNFLFVSLPFLILGFLLHRFKALWAERLQVQHWQVVLLIGLVVLESIANYRFISKTESVEQLLSLYIAAPLIFIYFLQQPIFGQTKELANLSTAIFLTHPFFMYSLRHDFIGQQTQFSLVVLTLSFIAGIVLVGLNKKFKYLL